MNVYFSAVNESNIFNNATVKEFAFLLTTSHIMTDFQVVQNGPQTFFVLTTQFYVVTFGQFDYASLDNEEATVVLSPTGSPIGTNNLTLTGLLAFQSSMFYDPSVSLLLTSSQGDGGTDLFPLLSLLALLVIPAVMVIIVVVAVGYWWIIHHRRRLVNVEQSVNFTPDDAPPDNSSAL